MPQPKSRSAKTVDLLVLTAKAYQSSGGLYTKPVEQCYVAARRAGLSGSEALRIGANALYAVQNGGLVR